MNFNHVFSRGFMRTGFFSLVLLFSSSSVMAADIVTADFDTVLAGRSGEFGIWNYADNPSVYIFDFPSLNSQGRTFNRAMQLTEQFNEPYKRVFSLEELRKYLEAIRRNQANFAFGHDFLVSELVLFFNLASRDKIELLPEESELLDFLTNQRLIDSWRGFFRALKPNVVILSIPQVQERHDDEPRITEQARKAILTHELSHAEFYANPYYADYCRRFWNEKLTEAQRAVFQKFLAKYNYSVNQQELLINEMQAYLMFTPDSGSVNASKLGIDEKELEAMRALFRQGRPPIKLPM